MSVDLPSPASQSLQEVASKPETGLMPRPDAPARKLTIKNRVFLEHLCQGMSTLESYRRAGYKGKESAAYELRSQLREHLILLLEGQGVSRDGLMAEVARLSRIPLEETTSVSVRQKMDILRLLSRILPQPKEARVKITPFIVNVGIPDARVETRGEPPDA